jgi:Trk K+ transport system NAD-binding subunit
MKSIAIAINLILSRARRRNLLILARLLVLFIVLVGTFTVLFHYLMEREGQSHSWVTGIYWTLVVMSTLGFGDITFHSDVGRAFSVVVLLSGTIFMLVLLPFMFIQFFYVPWLEAQAVARAPRELAKSASGHVILTSLGLVEKALIKLLNRSNIDYVLIVSELAEALKLHDEGFKVMVGEVDDPETYGNARIASAALVLANRTDTANTNITFTVREASDRVAIVATASSRASVDILELAGCNQVLQLGEMLGQALARRILGRNAKSHVIGQFDQLLIAEGAAAGTPLVNRTLREIRIRDHVNVNVVGVWDRGRFQIAGPDTLIQETSVLVLAASKSQLDAYDALFCIYGAAEAPVVILGGGRVGRATATALASEGIDYRIVEKMPERIRSQDKYILGDAAELDILEQAGIRESSSVVVTTRDDDMNVYLTIYCRRLRPDIQILARANSERNVSTLHRAGADFVMSYATTGANVVFNLLKREDILLLAEGLDAFRVSLPTELIGKNLADSQIRQRTGCNVVAVIDGEQYQVTPNAQKPLNANSELIVIGDVESEAKFFNTFISRT